MAKAKIFWSGRSQAVRLPKDFRFDTATVSIARQGNAVILEPIAEDWKWLDGLHGKLDEDFIKAVHEKTGQQKRKKLDELFE